MKVHCTLWGNKVFVQHLRCQQIKVEGIVCGLPSPVPSLSAGGGPACFPNNALFNWILFGGHLNANLVMKETLKIYVCLIL